MLTRLIICLCIGSIIHAGRIATSISTLETTSANLSSANEPRSISSPIPFVIGDELTKLSTSCITPEEHEELSGYIVRWRIAILLNLLLIKEADAMIGLEELRNVLGFAPPGNWTKNRQPPSAEELLAAPTLEEYYELREPSREYRSLDSEYFFEHNFHSVIAFLDKRFPAIRKIFRHRFEEILRHYAGRAIDRNAVDHMIKEYLTICNRVNDAMGDMNSRTYECELARKSHR